MTGVITLYKPLGRTPLEMVTLLRKHRPDLATIKIGYAGRLDPMAEGLLLLLVGDTNKKRKQYESLTKEYELTIALGVATDSYDLLGKTTSVHHVLHYKKPVMSALASYIGVFEQQYPPFSSKPIAGKPLYYWARAGKADTINIPSKRVTIFSIRALAWQTMTGASFAKTAIERIGKVQGAFRQEELKNSWRLFVQTYGNYRIPLLSLTVICSSGTYMRSIAHELGQKTGFGACAFAIKRTKIGTHVLADALRME